MVVRSRQARSIFESHACYGKNLKVYSSALYKLIWISALSRIECNAAARGKIRIAQTADLQANG